MAAPHVAGVAALIISRTASKRMTPAAVAAALVRTASTKACPTRECRYLQPRFHRLVISVEELAGSQRPWGMMQQPALRVTAPACASASQLQILILPRCTRSMGGMNKLTADACVEFCCPRAEMDKASTLLCCASGRPWYPSVDGQFAASCTKSAHGHTSFFGAGLVNAAAAVKTTAKPHAKPHPKPASTTG